MHIWQQMLFSTCWGRRGSTAKIQKKGGAQGSVAKLNECTQLGCVSRFSSEKVYSTERRKNWDQNRPSNSPRHPKNREGEGPSRGVIQKCAHHERSRCAHKFWGEVTRGNLHPRTMRPWSSVGFGENLFASPRIRTKTAFFSPIEQSMPAPTSTRPEERAFVVDSGASMHMMSKKRIKLRRYGHSEEVQKPNSSVDC